MIEKRHDQTTKLAKYEEELYDFLKSVYDKEIIRNTTQIIYPYELDFYVPNRGLAMEYDGFKYHSDKWHKKDYHVKKTEMCKQINIRLIHVFESEWRYKNEITKSYIKDALGIYDRKIDSETECQVIEVTNSDALKFYRQNCLFEPKLIDFSYGLVSKHGLVSVMSFIKISHSNEYHIVGFCNKLNTHVRNSRNRLVHVFEELKNPSVTKIRLNRRWETGRKFIYLGFKKTKYSGPKPLFFDKQSNLLSKQELERKLGFTTKLSDSYLEKHTGYKKIFDCGFIEMEKHYQK